LSDEYESVLIARRKLTPADDSSLKKISFYPEPSSNLANAELHTEYTGPVDHDGAPEALQHHANKSGVRIFDTTKFYNANGYPRWQDQSLIDHVHRVDEVMQHVWWESRAHTDSAREVGVIFSLISGQLEARLFFGDTRYINITLPSGYEAIESHNYPHWGALLGVAHTHPYEATSKVRFPVKSVLGHIEVTAGPSTVVSKKDAKTAADFRSAALRAYGSGAKVCNFMMCTTDGLYYHF
jgi:hypothetical protein